MNAIDQVPSEYADTDDKALVVEAVEDRKALRVSCDDGGVAALGG